MQKTSTHINYRRHIHMDKDKNIKRNQTCISLHVPAKWKDIIVKKSWDEDRSINYLMKKSVEHYFETKFNIKLKG